MNEILRVEGLCKTFKLSRKQQKIERTKRKSIVAVDNLSFTANQGQLNAYLIPFYNSVQVMTSVFAHEMRWLPVIVTLAANVVYTGIAVWVLTRLFNSEKVMFSK